MSTWPLLLEAEQLAAALDDPQLLIVDCCSADSYARGHIPGAIHLSPAALQGGVKPAVGRLPAVAALQQLFSQLGLSADKQVVVYDDEGGGWAGRLIWILDVLGHSNYSYLDGGLIAWTNEGHPLEQRANVAEPVDFKVNINAEPIAEIEDILPRLNDADFAVWDARTPEEYTGSKVLAQRGGHIPGAINLDWVKLKDGARNQRLVDLKELQQTLDQLGLSRDKLIVTHCQTHHRSGLSYLAMKLLGYPRIKGYHGSWSEWGNRDDTPVRTGDAP